MKTLKSLFVTSLENCLGVAGSNSQHQISVPRARQHVWPLVYYPSIACATVYQETSVGL